LIYYFLKKRTKVKLRKEVKVLSNTVKAKIIGITPFVALIAFLTIGTTTDVWNPTWMVLLLIPVVPALLNTSRISLSYTFFVATVYVVFGIITDTWHPTWIIFLTIPIFYILFPGKRITIWRSKEYKRKEEKRKRQKNIFDKIKEEFYQSTYSNSKKYENDKEDPDVEVIFDDDRKK